MADENLAELLKTQKSLTEWLEDIKHKDVDSIRREDNEKRERLAILNRIIALPYDKPVQFEAIQLADNNPQFVKYLRENGDNLCALRLMPKKDGLAKLRMRGKSITFAYEWFKEQDLDPALYKADFVPHPPDYGWSTIFVVNKNGIQGEIIFGGHHLLTQGFYPKQAILFSFDFDKWSLSEDNAEALKHLKELTDYILVDDKKLQSRIAKELNGQFINDYLCGYFESTDSSVGTWFIDYNRILGKMLADINVTAAPIHTTEGVALTGRPGNHGKAEGIVRIVRADQIDHEFEAGQILVCAMTTPQHVPIMKRSSAIVTDQGGILCHAAIVARELGIPCIVGAEFATTKLKSGDRVSVNATAGTVIILD